jgi:hypothetical protein
MSVPSILTQLKIILELSMPLHLYVASSHDPKPRIATTAAAYKAQIEIFHASYTWPPAALAPHTQISIPDPCLLEAFHLASIVSNAPSMPFLLVHSCMQLASMASVATTCSGRHFASASMSAVACNIAEVLTLVPQIFQSIFICTLQYNLTRSFNQRSFSFCVMTLIY